MAPSSRGMTLTDGAILGLFFVQRYRFLTIEQFARAAGMKRAAASDQLRALERHGLLGHFGNVGMRGFGKTPKVSMSLPRWRGRERKAPHAALAICS
jgi:hypothetical protein